MHKKLMFISMIFLLLFSIGFANAAEKIDESNVSISYETFTCDGNYHCPQVTVTMWGTPLTKDKDFTVKYENGKYPGESKVKVSGKGNYSGSATITYTGILKKPKNLKVSYSSEYVSENGILTAIWESAPYCDGYSVQVLKNGNTISKRNNIKETEFTKNISKKGTYKVIVSATMYDSKAKKYYLSDAVSKIIIIKEEQTQPSTTPTEPTKPTTTTPTTTTPTKAAVVDKYTVKFVGNGATSGSMPNQKIECGKSVKLNANKFKKTGYKFVGWSTADKRGYIKSNKKKGKVSMKNFQLGSISYKNTASVKNLAKKNKTITLYAVWKGDGTQAVVDWAKIIATDNSFTYGSKPTTSRAGCYYCNGNKNKIKLGGKKFAKTYVCVTFINAAYVHGANDTRMRCVPQKNDYSKLLSGESLLSTNLQRFSPDVFKGVGKPAQKNLKIGDVLLAYKGNKRHTAMYIGNGKIVHAPGGSDCWGKDSITIGKLGNYGWYDSVIRYQGK